MPPKLLVSVRNAQEARLAAKAGVEIIDIKEPLQGSLGMASQNVLNECVTNVQTINTSCQLSAALGELSEHVLDETLSVPEGMTYVKIGLAGMAERPDWKRLWGESRDRLCSASNSRPHCIAVAYADFRNANAPVIEEVIEAAAETNCVGVLFDTFKKDHLRFSNWVNDQALERYLNLIHHQGMICSVAGKLTLDDVSHLSQFPVDVIAVRSAACRQGERTAEISTTRIQELQARIRQCSTSQVLEHP